MTRTVFAFRVIARLWVLCLVMLVVPGLTGAQTAPAAPQAPARAAAEAPKDPLGRTAPRGTVMGFLNAARKGENALAREYLDTRLNGSRPRSSRTSCTSSSTRACLPASRSSATSQRARASIRCRRIWSRWAR